MGIINDVNSLEPSTMRKCRAFIDECKKENIVVGINETIRTLDTQVLYFLQGTLGLVKDKNPNIYNEFNALRKQFKFWALTQKEADTRITWTLDSAHFSGKAFDACPLDSNGKFMWNAPDAIWAKMAECGIRVGLYPGRKFGDNPHFENRT
jgi:hypothetical protein